MDASRLTACTFDCYGTLIDWEGGLGTFLYDFALRRRDDRANGRELRERWEAIQFEVIGGDYRRYSDVLAESLRLLAAERGWSYSEEDGKALARSMRSWQPFPDTRPALQHAHDAGLKLIIVSNTDRDILEHSIRHMEVPIDAVVTAEDVGSYKPALPHFERALEVVDAPADQILHVAFGFKYDIGPAQELGFRSAWVNRRGDPRPGAAVPDLEWRDLWGLAQLADGR
ncbi:MAG TPA: haloacid dehalogenase type II [Thermoleophilaceae bacterium]|nr:haloacid dehalogenase type II [Thermoleophilaceae bacterium]